MRIDRRSFLQGAGAGAAVGALSLGGCATLGGVALRRPPSAEVYVADLMDQLRAVRSTPPPRAVDAAAERAGLPAGVVHDALSALLVVGALRDAPPALQRDPGLQRCVWAESCGIGRQALVLGDHLDGLGADGRRRLGRVLVERPEVEREMRARLVDDAIVCRLGAGRADQIDAWSRVLARHLQRGEPTPVVDRACRRLEIIADACDIPRARWREAADRAVELGPEEAAAAVEALEAGRRAAVEQGTPPTDAHALPAKIATVGLVVMGISGMTTMTGVGMNMGGNLGGLFVMTAGAVIAVVGLVILAVAGIVAMNE